VILGVILGGRWSGAAIGLIPARSDRLTLISTTVMISASSAIAKRGLHQRGDH
jgi:hypothetical protein